MNELMIKKLNESEERMARLSKIFGWKHFQNAKPFKFTIKDCIARIDSNIAMIDKMLVK